MNKTSDQVEHFRLKNNTNTINILRLSFKHFPEESKALLIEVNKGDAKISQLLSELANNNTRDYTAVLDELEALRAENNKPWMELFRLAEAGDSIEYNTLKVKADEYSKKINL